MFSSDKPIVTMQGDLLSRAVFSKQLAKAILSYKSVDNFTVALCGRWGSGKTSIINMTVEEIQTVSNSLPDNEKLIVIHFNPWNYSDRNQLISQFFETIISKLKIKTGNEKMKQAGDALERYSGLLEYTSYIPVIGQCIFAAVSNELFPEFASNVSFKIQRTMNFGNSSFKCLFGVICAIHEVPNQNHRQIALLYI